MRGIAALAVAAGHLSQMFQVQVGYGNSAVAVDFFFMLSGFVLAHAYSARLDNGYGFWRFVLARIIRLYPLIVLGTVLGAIAARNVTPVGALARQIALGFLTIPEFQFGQSHSTFFPLDPPAWSLFFEMIASILFGLGVWRRVKTMLIWPLVLAGIIFLVGRGTFDTGYTSATLHLGLVRMMFGFGAGVLLYQLRGRIPMPRGAFIVLALAMTIFFLAPFINRYAQLAFVVIFSPALILAGAKFENDRLNSLFRLSGDLSYPIYILHYPVFLLARASLGSSALAALAAFMMAVISSALVLKIYDEPLREWLTALARRQRKPR